MVLAQNDGLTQDELTKIVKVDKAATARRIRSLEKKKLFFEKLTLRIKEIKNYIIMGLVGVLALILLIQINPETKKEFNNLILSFIFQEETDDSSINLRNFFIDTGIELFNQKPITGAGLNNFAYYVKNYTANFIKYF